MECEQAKIKHMRKAKILIIEGPDNCGKDTLIKTISSTSKVKVMHCSKPEHHDSPEESLRAQRDEFSRIADSIIDLYKKNEHDFIIMNRFHYGEWVYGQMYRNEDPDSIRRMLAEIDNQLASHICQEDIGLVLLTATDPSFLSKNEDGLSLSGGDSSLIKKECDGFFEAYRQSLLPNKCLVYVDNGNGGWCDPVSISHKVIKLLK